MAHKCQARAAHAASTSATTGTHTLSAMVAAESSVAACAFPPASGVHTVEPFAGAEVPLGQAVQFVAPPVANESGAQTEHTAEPLAGANIPVGHDVQLLAPRAAKLPAAHEQHAPPVPALYVPASHATHEASDVPLLMLVVVVPSGQTVQE